MSTKKKLAIGGGLGVLGLLGLILAMRDDDDAPTPDLPLNPTPARPGPEPPDMPWEPGFRPPEDPTDPIFTPTPAKPSDPKRIIDDYLAPGTRTNTLYQVQRGDDPTKVARRALDGDPRTQQRVNRGHPALDDYIRLTTAVVMNVNAYGVLWTPDDTHGRPKYETIEDEEGDRFTIHYAYLPQNFDNLAAMQAGQPPKRSYSLAGVGGIPGGSYGLIWLPNAYVTGAGKLFVVGDDLPAELRAFMPDWYV